MVWKGNKMSVKIITDSTCDLTPKEANRLGIAMISIKLKFGDKVYTDKVDITNEEFYRLLAQSEEIPTTTLINPQEFLDEFEKYPDDDIIVMPIAEGLSGTYNSALLAKDMSGRSNIYVLETGSTCIGLGLLVKQAAAMKESGLSAEEIYDKLQSLVKRLRVVAVVDTLKYLVKNGRLSGFSGTIGTILNIKPIITVKDGEVNSIAKCRGLSEAYKKINEIITECYPMDREQSYIFAHGCKLDALADFKKVVNLDGENYVLGSVVGCHAGPGTIGIAYFEK